MPKTVNGITIQVEDIQRPIAFHSHPSKPCSHNSDKSTQVTPPSFISFATNRNIGLAHACAKTNNHENDHTIQQPIPIIAQPRKRKYSITTRVPNDKALIPQKQLPKGHLFPEIFFSNTRSMINKVDEISTLISLNSYDIIVITES